LSKKEGERKCSVSGCRRTLSSQVPAWVTMCGTHQYLAKEKEHKISELVLKFGLSPEDAQFLHAYLDWNQKCFLADLAAYLGVAYSTLYTYFKEKAIEGKRVKKKGERARIVLFAEEAARVIDLFRNWVTIPEIEKKTNCHHSTILEWARKGLLGPLRHDLGGRLVLKKEVIPYLQQYKDTIKIVRRQKANRPRRFLRRGEVGASDLASLFHVSKTTIYNLIRQGNIQAIKRKGRWVIIGPPSVVKNQASTKEAERLKD